MPPTTSLNPLGLTVEDPTSNTGFRNLTLRLVLNDREFVFAPESTEERDGILTAEGTVADILRVKTSATPVKGINAVVMRHTLINPTSRPVVVESAATGQFHAEARLLHGLGSWLGWDLRYCHTDNVRTEHYPHCQMEYPYERMLPVKTVLLGAGEDQAFPAVYLKDTRSGCGLVCAAATQALNYTTFEIRKRAMVNDGVFEEFSIHHDPGHAGGFVIPANASMDLDGLFFQLLGPVAVEDCFSDYIDFLTTTHAFRGGTTPILGEAFHCTWNYGPFAEQTEAALLPTAEAIARDIPNIKWFLIDGGYYDGGLDTTFLDRCYPCPNESLERSRWPAGMRDFSDKLRRLGLRPGLWWSPTARVDSKLFADHPDWFLRRTNGEVFLIDKKQAFLDYSHPGALDFLDRTLAVILGEWGMDACKMDFWSQNFEARGMKFHDPTLTAVQARARLFATVRKHLPEDGVFMTCVATGMGNPFIGQWADTYRNTIDIGLGVWHEQINSCFWALPTLGFEGRKTFLPNLDSVGILPEYPDNENEFRLTWCHINMGLLETGGRMETWPEKWVAAMRKLTDRCDRGHRVRCPDDQAFTGIPLPECLYVNFPPGSRTAEHGIRQSVALFNWSEEPRVVSILRKRLGHKEPVRAENFWTGEILTFKDEFLSQRLGPRSAVLWDIQA
jgi:hypothetical protein